MNQREMGKIFCQLVDKLPLNEVKKFKNVTSFHDEMLLALDNKAVKEVMLEIALLNLKKSRKEVKK